MRTIDIASDNHVFRITSDYTNEILIPCIFDGASESLTAAAPACSVDVYLSKLDATSNGVAATLADGQVNGQLKKVQAIVVSGGATTLTIASPVSASLDVVTFGDVGDYVILIWSSENSYWRIIETGNDADGATAPAVA